VRMQVRFAQADPGTIPEGFAAEYVRALSHTAGAGSATAVTIVAPGILHGLTWFTETAFAVRAHAPRERTVCNHRANSTEIPIAFLGPD
jgi:hypothetical protein